MINIDVVRDYLASLNGSYSLEIYSNNDPSISITPYRDLRIRPIDATRTSIIHGKRHFKMLGMVYGLEDAYGHEKYILYQKYQIELNKYDFIMRFEMLFGYHVEFITESTNDDFFKVLIDVKTGKDVFKDYRKA